MNSLDYLIVGIYAVVLIAIATYVSLSKKGEKKTAEEYFLAGRTLPWWAIGTSLIAANIAADQIIGFVFDASGNPISGVTVTSSGGGSGTTDISGGFLFAATAGAQKVTASKTGYFDNFKMITVGGTTNMNIVLQTQTGIQSSVSLTGLTGGTVTGTGTGRASNNAEDGSPL